MRTRIVSLSLAGALTLGTVPAFAEETPETEPATETTIEAVVEVEVTGPKLCEQKTGVKASLCLSRQKMHMIKVSCVDRGRARGECMKDIRAEDTEDTASGFGQLRRARRDALGQTCDRNGKTAEEFRTCMRKLVNERSNASDMGVARRMGMRGMSRRLLSLPSAEAAAELRSCRNRNTAEARKICLSDWHEKLKDAAEENDDN